MARLSHRGTSRTRAQGDAERRQLPADPFPGDAGQDREGGGRLPDQARTDPARGRRIQAVVCVAHDRRYRRGEQARRRGAQGLPGEGQVNKPPALFNRLALIGTGLIGSSIARAAKLQNAVGSIVATARSPETRRRVAELGLADQVVETNAEAVEGADLVIVCIPVGACGPVAADIGPRLAPGAIVSDVGSVKASVARDMAPHLPKGVHFVPAHPVAGTEYSGPDAGFAELFVNRWCILTPPAGADQASTD